MDGTETGKQGVPAGPGRRRAGNNRYVFGRFTRQEAVLGLAALGLFYWGSVATLVGYRLDRTAAQHGPCVTAPGTPRALRGPRIKRLHRTEVTDAFLVEPAWAPYPRPRVLGPARGLPDGVLVDLAR
jgi:hypothetical protein